MPWMCLLPLRSVTVRLRFSAPSRPGFFHQAALTAWLRHLVPGDWGEEPRLWLEASDSGRASFAAREEYRFNVFCCAGGEERLQALLTALCSPPAPTSPVPEGLAFGPHVHWLDCRDFFTDAVNVDLNALFCYDRAALERELTFWQSHRNITVRFLAPVRLLLPKAQRVACQGEARFVRDGGQLRAGLLERRVIDTVHALLRSTAPRLVRPPSAFQESTDSLFWLDSEYYDSAGAAKPMGGALGTVHLTVDADNAVAVWPYFILGQYLGIGQRRGFGWGRYRLETATRQGTLPPRRPSRTVLARAADLANLEQAHAAIQQNRAAQLAPRQAMRQEAAEDWQDACAPEVLDVPSDSLGLESLARQLGQARYQPPPLKGVILRPPGKAPRPLAIPPFRDRVAQRAVVQILSQDVEALMARSSFGYRRGLSRMNARDRIQWLYRQGYRWFFEADIEDFFDSVAHELLEVRLRSLLPDDPVVDLLLGWVSAPVQFRGQRIERPRGLPQGSPVSPLLANLILDDFDSDLETLGMALVRFADDFIVVCKSREEAEAAAARAEASLAELGLTVNPQKTRIGHFDQGFEFLGYAFLRDLAIDHPRDRTTPPKPLKLETLPPHSWLAQLAQRSPDFLEKLVQEPQAPLRKSEAAASARVPIMAAGDDLTPVVSKSMAVISTLTPKVVPVAAPVAATPWGTAVFITGEGVRLAQREGQLHISDPQGGVRSLPWHGLATLVLIGRHHLTTPCLQAALQQGVAIHFASAGGHYQGILTADEPGAEGHQLWLLQRERFAEPEQALALARVVVQARVHNQLEVLRLRSRGGSTPIEEALNGLRQCREQAASAATLAALNGFEGLAARHYFAGLALQLPSDWGFSGRTRQPPRDPFNALLSLGYTTLYAHIETVIRAMGLLPWIGFYHQQHGRHAALASDLMEPFRHIVERCALALLNRGQLKTTDFLVNEEGCRLSRHALRRYLKALSERLAEPLSERAGEEAFTLHEYVHRQGRQLMEGLRGRSSDFQCFKLR